jgi:hypothetical protein
MDPTQGPLTFVLGVGSTFNQDIPNAMMTCRTGYCHGFEELGIPYFIADVRDLESVLGEVPNPVCMLLANDLHLMDKRTKRLIKTVRCIVWVQPWFPDSDLFFKQHGLDPQPWHLSKAVKHDILDMEPDFCFTATASSGLSFFESWMSNGQDIRSMPLACDTKYYNRDTPDFQDFKEVKLSFVGGYWQSKGYQIDRYLRPFENDLTIYGYNRWPYTGYRGMLSRDMEASLYRQARVSPTINEPTVALMKGQINERVFKVTGSFGCTVVDAVPEYRELYSEDELLVADGPDHFRELVQMLLSDDELRDSYRQRGFEATVARHTYRHRARTVLDHLGIKVPSDGRELP